MSKTITVPDIGQYPVKLRINQTDYTLTPGATATVPDEVAALLARIVAAQPAPDPDGWKDAAATLGDIDAAAELPVVSTLDNGTLLGVSGGKWGKVDPPSGLPTVTGDDNGKLLGVSSGAWAAVTAPQNMLTIIGEVTIDGDDMTVTTETTPAELAAAVAAKRPVQIYTSLDVGLSAPVQTMLPLRQVIGEEYRFIGFNDISTSGGGASVTKIALLVEDGALTGTVTLAQTPVET